MQCRRRCVIMLEIGLSRVLHEQPVPQSTVSVDSWFQNLIFEDIFHSIMSVSNKAILEHFYLLEC